MHTNSELNYMEKEVNRVLSKEYNIHFIKVNKEWLRSVIDKPHGGTFAPEEIVEMILANLEYVAKKLKE